jgi:hypothetical protein
MQRGVIPEIGFIVWLKTYIQLWMIYGAIIKNPNKTPEDGKEPKVLYK